MYLSVKAWYNHFNLSFQPYLLRPPKSAINSSCTEWKSISAMSNAEPLKVRAASSLCPHSTTSKQRLPPETFSNHRSSLNLCYTLTILILPDLSCTHIFSSQVNSMLLLENLSSWLSRSNPRPPAFGHRCKIFASISPFSGQDITQTPEQRLVPPECGVSWPSFEQLGAAMIHKQVKQTAQVRIPPVIHRNQHLHLPIFPISMTNAHNIKVTCHFIGTFHSTRACAILDRHGMVYLAFRE